MEYMDYVFIATGIVVFIGAACGMKLIADFHGIRWKIFATYPKRNTKDYNILYDPGKNKNWPWIVKRVNGKRATRRFQTKHQALGEYAIDYATAKSVMLNIYDEKNKLEKQMDFRENKNAKHTDKTRTNS